MSKDAMNHILVERLELDLARRLAALYEGRMEDTARRASDLCKSPIEELFFCAWYSLVFSDNLIGPGIGGDHVLVFPDEERWPPEPKVSRSDGLELTKLGPAHPQFSRVNMSPWGYRWGRLDAIYPQHPFGPYIADFLLVRVDQDNRGWSSTALVIECDGKEFHDAHQGQVDRDRARDRYFQQAGFPVMRFSGRELYQDFARCADEANEALEAALLLAATRPHIKAEVPVGV